MDTWDTGTTSLIVVMAIEEVLELGLALLLVEEEEDVTSDTGTTRSIVFIAGEVLLIVEGDVDEALLEDDVWAEEVDVVDDVFADSGGQVRTVIVVAEVPPWTVTVDVLMVVAADALEAGAVTVLMIVVVVTLLLVA